MSLKTRPAGSDNRSIGDSRVEILRDGTTTTEVGQKRDDEDFKNKDAPKTLHATCTDTYPHRSLIKYHKPKPIKKTRPVLFYGREEAPDPAKIMQNVLDRIFLPRCWREDGKLMRQTVSRTPATRIDVIQLVEKLDKRLQNDVARNVGLCYLRRAIFKELFQEIIREVLLNSVSRGKLLHTLFLEFNKTFESFEELNDSAKTYAMRKFLFGETQKDKLRAEYERLERAKAANRIRINELKQQRLDNGEEDARLRDLEQKKFLEELGILKKANLVLRLQLEAILAPKKIIK